jgi:hypothetical protein
LKDIKEHLEARLKHVQKRIKSIKLSDQTLAEKSKDFKQGYDLGFDIGYWQGKESIYMDLLDSLEESKQPLQKETEANTMLVIKYQHPLHGVQTLKCKQLLNKNGEFHVVNIRGVTFQTIDSTRILNVETFEEPVDPNQTKKLTQQDIKKLETMTAGDLARHLEGDILHSCAVSVDLPLVDYVKDFLTEREVN